MKTYHFYTVVLISLLLVSKYCASAEEPKSKWLNDNPCMIKVVITNTVVDGVTTTSKEEILNVKTVMMVPTIGNYLLSFTIQELRYLLIVDRMQDQIIHLRRLGCFV